MADSDLPPHPSPSQSAPRPAPPHPPDPLPARVRTLGAALCTTGLLTGTLFFAASLSPSLLPRDWVMQGILSGFSLAAGYAIGVTLRWIWGYLELPVLDGGTQLTFLLLAAALCGVVAFAFLWQASEWQNSIRALMDMDPVETARPYRVGSIAALTFAVLLGIGRLFRLTFQLVARRLGRRIPRRVANLLGLVAAWGIFWSVIDGVVFRQALRSADGTFQQIDARMEPEMEPPASPLLTGSPTSLVDWEDLGRTGRDFIAGATTAAELGQFFDREVSEPIRIYVGLNASESIEERARLAVAELQRTGAFERSVLVLATPTGTGWIDPSSMRSLEYLHRGDVATVAVQYSYLPSWLSLIVEPDYGAETAAAVFAAVYGSWTERPLGERPDLYLHGLSLGALHSQEASDLYDVIADPFAGALWAGPPFRSETWREFTRQREVGSPAWLPRFRDNSVVRFMNQHGLSSQPGDRWGPLRILFLQYASDPVTFFEPEVFYRRPEWLQEPRGPDVTDRLRWYPVVTMLQLVADLAVGDTAPMGFGHVYAPEHYAEAWRAVTDPSGWRDEDFARLKAHLARRDRTE